MRSFLSVLTLLGVMAFGAAAAENCSIDNSEGVPVGRDNAVKGTCSNSGLPIECNWAVDGGITCTGPEGDFSGDDLDTLITSACGCG
jgi:hypothetical protein